MHLYFAFVCEKMLDLIPIIIYKTRSSWPPIIFKLAQVAIKKKKKKTTLATLSLTALSAAPP